MNQSRSCRAWPLLLALALLTVETAWGQPAGPRVYVTNNFGPSSNSVSVIDSGANRLVATIPVGARPVGIAVSPNGARAYVANESGNSVSVIDTATNTVVDTVTPVPEPKDVTVSPDGQLVGGDHRLRNRPAIPFGRCLPCEARSKRVGRRLGEALRVRSRFDGSGR